jgi:hypothetical protein
MAGEAEQLLVATAAAEPDEGSRWAMICLLACVSVPLLCISWYMLLNSEDIMANSGYPSVAFLLVFLLVVLGLALCALCLVLVDERFNGHPEGDRAWVDIMLSP